MTEQRMSNTVNISGNAMINIAYGHSCINAGQNNEKGIWRDPVSNIDSTEDIIDKAKDIQKTFVRTTPYKKALEKMKKNNVILYVGNSGSGKTENSIMLAAEYGKEYKLIFVEGNDSGKVEIEKILEEVKANGNYKKKEMIIFDDFLGKTHLNADEAVLVLMYDLIKVIGDNPNKKLILNTRKTILEDAKTKSVSFCSCIEDGSCVVIDAGKLEETNEKIEIIARYAIEYNMQESVGALVSDEKIFRAILKHENFSPLIIKEALNLYSQNNNNNNSLEKIIMEKLDNPNNVWDFEVKALNCFSRKYLYILYSLSDTWVEEQYINECFNACIDSREYTENVTKTRQRLVGLVKFDDGNRIKFVHPSVMDYLKNEITVQEIQEILDHAIYIEQIERLDSEQQRIKLLLQDIESFFDLKVMPCRLFGEYIEVPNYIGIKYLEYMVKLKIETDQEIVNLILENVFKCGRILLMHSADIVLQVIKRSYDVSCILNNEEYMRELLDCLNYENMWDLIQIISDKGGCDLDFKKLKPYIQNEVKEKLDCAVSDAIIEYIEENIEDHAKEYFDNLENGESFYMEDVAEELRCDILEEIDIPKLANEVRVKLCEEHNLRNYEDALQEYEIGNDDYLDFGFMTDYLEEYWKERELDDELGE